MVPSVGHQDDMKTSILSLGSISIVLMALRRSMPSWPFHDVSVFAIRPWHMYFLWLYIRCEILACIRLGQGMTYPIGAGSTSVQFTDEAQRNAVGRGTALARHPEYTDFHSWPEKSPPTG